MTTNTSLHRNSGASPPHVDLVYRPWCKDIVGQHLVVVRSDKYLNDDQYVRLITEFTELFEMRQKSVATLRHYDETMLPG